MQASKIWKIKARKFISENRQSIAHVWSSFCFSQKFKPQDFYEIISEQWNIIMETAKHKWRWSVSRCTSIFNSAELSGLLKLENSSRQSQFNLTLVIFANNTAGVVTSLWVYLFHTGAWARVSAIQKARKLCTKPLRQKKGGNFKALQNLSRIWWSHFYLPVWNILLRKRSSSSHIESQCLTLKNSVQYFSFSSKYNKNILRSLLTIHITNSRFCKQSHRGRSYNKKWLEFDYSKDKWQQMLSFLYIQIIQK